MKQTCEMTALRYETLKFYCNQGLVPGVKRDSLNRRVFDDRDISWINSLTCLKDCGMGIAEMKAYMELCLRGQETIPERKEILRRKREELEGELARVQESIAYIDRKQAFYDDMLAGKTESYSNLTNL
ncbi:MAG: MerR family transcriptional regulator [Faecousia sp.]